MSQKEGEQKKRSKNFWRIILTIFIFGYLFFRTVPSLFAIAFKFVLPESVVIEDTIDTEAIVIKKENLYRAEGNGNIEIINDEGNKVAKGSQICKVVLADGNSALKQQVGELDKKIENLKSVEKEKDIIKKDEEKLEESIENIIFDIQKNIGQGEYENIELLKEKLALYYGKQQDFSGENHLINQSIDSLQKKRDTLKKQLSENAINYYSSEAGIVSYKIDGYEEIYSFHNKADYNYSNFKTGNLKTTTIEDSQEVNVGEPIFKIMDNFEWYMVLKIEDLNDISNYEEGDSILVSNKELDEEFKGSIININKESDKGTILCKFNKGFHKIYDKRFINLNIIRYKHNGFKIPKKSIVEKDNLEGVYIKDISGIIKFKPVEILKEDDKFVYISSGDDNNNIFLKGKDKPVKTITTFDEILLNTKNIKEGMIVN